ncbi:MAG: LemA family protein [Myxococcota bacterium]|jgi:LemA protein|nr:LemA family protein [Myxococcota bacterium]|tara:strand:- start:219 stop:824 length:606 start_codon:yes stop_codon:yes gene_type:complete
MLAAAGVLMGVLVLGGIILLVITVGIYNKLVSLRNRYKNAFAQIDVQLKRRYDLIPNLVETAKKAVDTEVEAFENLARARTGAMSARSAAAANPGDPAAMGALAGAESLLTGALRGFYAVAENYPTLQSMATMTELMEELTSTENKVAFARQGYNDSVTVYNTSREVFPAVLFAAMLGFQSAALWEVEDASERQAVKVSFD